jgi:hypothetical protein
MVEVKYLLLHKKLKINFSELIVGLLVKFRMKKKV